MCAEGWSTMAVHTPVRATSIRTGGRYSSVGPCTEQATLGPAGILQAPIRTHKVLTQLRKCYDFFASTSCHRICRNWPLEPDARIIAPVVDLNLVGIELAVAARLRPHPGEIRFDQRECHAAA